MAVADFAANSPASGEIVEDHHRRRVFRPFRQMQRVVGDVAKAHGAAQGQPQIALGFALVEKLGFGAGFGIKEYALNGRDPLTILIRNNERGKPDAIHANSGDGSGLIAAHVNAADATLAQIEFGGRPIDGARGIPDLVRKRPGFAFGSDGICRCIAICLRGFGLSNATPAKRRHNVGAAATGVAVVENAFATP